MTTPRRAPVRIALATLAIFAAPVPAVAQTFTGMVAEQLTLVPAHGAVVTLFRGARLEELESVGITTTDEAGAFSLPVPGPGTYRVQADMAGLSTPLSAALELSTPDAVGEVALLLPSKLLLSAMSCMEETADGPLAAVVGTVRDPAADIVLPGARVTATYREGPLVRRIEVESDAAGRYRICPPADAGRLTFETYLLGERVQHPYLEIESAAVVLHDLDLDIGSRAADLSYDVVRQRVLTEAAAHGLADFRGEVTDRDAGTPLPYAVVRLADTQHQTVTDEAGHFSFTDIGPGLYTLEIRSLGYAVVSEPIDVPPGKDVFLDLRVAPQAVELEGLEVTTRAAVEELALATPFRRNVTYGLAMVEEEQRGAMAYETLRRSSAGLRVSERYIEGVGRILCVETNRRVQSLRGPGECANAQVIVDGVRIPDGGDFLLRTPATEIESIEFVTPVQAQILYGIGGQTASGVVVVYTRGKGPYASPLRDRRY